MAEKCTNTSSPVERWIKPYPFAPLNHFTVPFSLTDGTPFTNREELFFQVPGLRSNRPKPPSGNRQICSVAFMKCRGSYFQKGKDSSIPQPRNLSLWELRSPTIWRVSTTQPTSTLPLVSTTGSFTGIEQKIISSIKTFRKRN